VLVSLYEGFGLPIVEAMACGAPVLTSTTASMPEVAGDAALFADPTEVDDIAASLRTLASNDALRADLRLRGLQRAATYQWSATARKVRDALVRCR
jgi:glycosyltransferase involved in cell wall biosynthesis